MALIASTKALMIRKASYQACIKNTLDRRTEQGILPTPIVDLITLDMKLQFQIDTMCLKTQNKRGFYVKKVKGYCAIRCRREDAYNGG
jgi:hypothetical protein